MKIEYTGKSFDVEVKRFYVPGLKFMDDCPKCNKGVVMDLARDYLSYPSFNEPNAIRFYCQDCDAEWSRDILLELTVRAV